MSRISDTEIKDMLNALENDSDFEYLRKLYETPNCFTIMGDKRREEWHSSFVCWLLNPKGNHRLGEFALVKFLELIESKNEKLTIDKTDIKNMEFETELSMDGSKQKGRIDIFGKSKSLILVIENKIKASETINGGVAQSDLYLGYCEKEYRSHQRVYVLLKASPYTFVNNENFIHITYQELLDTVVKPAYEKCDELKLDDTKIVLKQYELDITNPLSDFVMAEENKDLSKKIYESHKEVMGVIRETMDDVDRDENSYICKFFYKYRKYINNAILMPLGKSAIVPKMYVKKLKGKELTEYLIDYGYIIPGRTELIYKFMGKTCIIKVDDNRKFWAGYYCGEYNGTQEIDPVVYECNTLFEAEQSIEEKLGSENRNGGKSAYGLILLNSGVKDAEGKAIGEIPGIVH